MKKNLLSDSQSCLSKGGGLEDCFALLLITFSPVFATMSYTLGLLWCAKSPQPLLTFKVWLVKINAKKRPQTRDQFSATSKEHQEKQRLLSGIKIQYGYRLRTGFYWISNGFQDSIILWLIAASLSSFYQSWQINVFAHYHGWNTIWDDDELIERISSPQLTSHQSCVQMQQQTSATRPR